jgi:hypothetical protein
MEVPRHPHNSLGVLAFYNQWNFPQKEKLKIENSRME